MYYCHHVLSSLLFHGQLSMSCFCGSIYTIVFVNINWIYTHHVKINVRSKKINSMSFVLFGNQRCWFCFAPASTKCCLFCSEMNDTAFVLLRLLAFVFILQHVICFVPKSTMLILFCSSINNMWFVLFQNEQYGFCFAPPLTTWLFVLFRDQHHGFCFHPATSTTWLLFSPGNINDMAFVLFWHQ